MVPWQPDLQIEALFGFVTIFGKNPKLWKNLNGSVANQQFCNSLHLFIEVECFCQETCGGLNDLKKNV